MKRITAIIAAAAIMPVTAQAKEWVHVSGWAYNEVSNFTNEGLMPECMANVTDYRVPATMEQICELIYSVRSIYGAEQFGVDKKMFADTDNDAIEQVVSADTDIAEVVRSGGVSNEELSAAHGGAAVYSDWYGGYVMYVHPDEPVTRSTAVKLYFKSMMDMGAAHPVYDVADMAAYLVKKAGIMDAQYNPDSYMTIEQAIVAAYRLYNLDAQTVRPDGEGMEGLVQTYSNGVGEYRRGSYLILKRGDTVVGEFETDVYKNIYCTDLTDGRTVIAAQTYRNYADIYDTAGNVISVIKNNIDGFDGDNIITRRITPSGWLYGLSCVDGTEILMPDYSPEEIQKLKNDNFVMPQGSVYGKTVYFTERGTGHLYAAENGNDRLLTADEVYMFVLAGDSIYYTVNNGGESGDLYRIGTDGSSKECIRSGKNLLYMRQGYTTDNGYASRSVQGSFSLPDGWLYYNDERGILYRTKTDANGTVNERVLENGGVTLEYLGEGYAYYTCENILDESIRGTYLTDGINTVKISDKPWTITQAEDGFVYFMMENDMYMSFKAPIGSGEYSPNTLPPAPALKYDRVHDGDLYFEDMVIHLRSDLSDDSYDVGISEKGWCFTDRKEVVILDDMYVLDRCGNFLITSNLNNSMYIYDMTNRDVAYDVTNNAVVKEIKDGKGDVRVSEDKTYFTYTTVNGNVCRCDIATFETFCIYPCKGIYSGKTKIVPIGSSFAFADEEENYASITEREIQYFYEG